MLSFLTIDVIVRVLCEPGSAAVGGSGQWQGHEHCVGGGTDEEDDGGKVSWVACWRTGVLGDAGRGGGGAWGGAGTCIR